MTAPLIDDEAERAFLGFLLEHPERVRDITVAPDAVGGPVRRQLLAILVEADRKGGLLRLWHRLFGVRVLAAAVDSALTWESIGCPQLAEVERRLRVAGLRRVLRDHGERLVAAAGDPGLGEVELQGVARRAAEALR